MTADRGPFADWTDEVLLKRLRAAADQCVRVSQMSDAEKDAPGKKGNASPRQAATFSAVCALQFAREAERRGIDTGLAEAKES